MNRKPIRVNGHEFASIKEACQAYNVTAESVARRAAREGKTAAEVIADIRPRPTYVTRVEITFITHTGRPLKVSTIEDLKAAINRDYAQSGRIPPGEITVPLKLTVHPRITRAGGYANREKEA